MSKKREIQISSTHNASETDQTPVDPRGVCAEREKEEKVFFAPSFLRLHKNFIQSTHKTCVVEALATESRL